MIFYCNCVAISCLLHYIFLLCKILYIYNREHYLVTIPFPFNSETFPFFPVALFTWKKCLLGLGPNTAGTSEIPS